MAQRERVPFGCTRLLVPLLLCLAAAGGWSQQVDVIELDTTAGRSFPFQSYTGPQPVVESIGQIAGIGEVLSRNLRAGGSRGDYFGKYTVIRAFQPSETRLSADIIVLSPRAQIDDIRNVRRIVAGYLAAAFGYGPGQADQLAVLVTKYNAAYRGDLAALSQKYTPLVMSHLAAENAGIALNYAEWPGKTRLIVPLGRAAGAQAGAAPTGPAGPAAGGPAGPAGPAAGAARSAEAAPPAAAGGTASGGTTAGGPAVGGAAAGGTTAGGPAVGGTTAGGAAPAGAASTAGGTEAGSSAPGQQVTAPGGAAESPEEAGGQVTTPGEAPSAAEAAGPQRTPGLFGVTWYWWLLALAALLVLALLVFLLVRLIDRLLRPSYDRELQRSVREGHPLVEMVVIPQNRRIGHRNIHYLRPGASASVGGGRSVFLVYFVPVPRRLGVLRYDGRRYSFEPVRAELFPGVGGEVTDCLGKGIPARSLRGYRFTIIFRKFIPPLEEINQLMRSTRPGAPRRLPPA